MRHPKVTARARLTEALADEILSQSSENVFGIESEHQLCRRFSVSRVTVRLALSDLEARGLIFRRHGKGTFAYGRLNRIQRPIGILLRTLPDAEDWPILEIIRGFHHGAASLPANVLLIHTSPQEWSPEMIKSLGGILLFPSGITQPDLDSLKLMKMPTLTAWAANIPGNHIEFGHRDAARIVAERMLLEGHEQLALVTRFEKQFDSLKREGILAALKEVGLPSQRLVEYSMRNNESGAQEIIANLVNYRPRITAAIISDDSRAAHLIECLHKNTPLRVPAELSIASLQSPPGSTRRFLDLSSVQFDYFEGGKRAVEVLNRAFLTGAPSEDIVLQGVLIKGSTVAVRSAHNVDMSTGVQAIT